MQPLKAIAILAIIITRIHGSAADFRVTGEITDSTGVPEIYATVRIYSVSDSIKPVSLGTTDDNGKINQLLKKPGDYRLTVASVGKTAIDLPFNISATSPTTDLGKITIHEASTELAEVSVIAQRPLVSREIDRIGYDVAGDPDSETSNLREIMRKVPLVTVDEQGNIKVKGSDNFKIYKNGRPNNSFTKNAKEIFAALPASSIKRIEVITDPGAREDAEGATAILNIVTDNETAIKGVMGNVWLYLDSNNPLPLPGAWIQTQLDKVTFAMGGGYNNTNKRESENEMASHTDYFDSGSSLDYTSKSSSPSDSGWWSIEGSWEPDTLNLVSVEVNGWNWAGKNDNQFSTRMTTADGSTIYAYKNHNFYNRNSYFDIDGSINYQRSTRLKDEAITFSYRISTTKQDIEDIAQYYDMENCPFGYDGLKRITDQRFVEHTLQVDWSRPYGKHHKLDVGAKAIFRRNHSKTSNDYTGSDSYTYDDFSHNTTVAAAYADYRYTIKKWSLRAGLRYEYSNLNAKFHDQIGYEDAKHPDYSSELNDWVPNAAIAFNLNDQNSFRLSYNRRISRPGISYLDPAVNISPTAISFGNPDLNSSTNNNISFNYTFIGQKLTMNVDASGSFSNNALTNKEWAENDIKYTTYDNIGRTLAFSTGLYIQWTPWPKTKFMTNTNIGWNKIEVPDAQNSRWWFNPYVRITQTLPYKIDISLSGFWWSGTLYSAYAYQQNDDSYIGYSLSLTKKFLKDDRLTCTIWLERPFGPSTRTDKTYYATSEYRSITENRQLHGQFIGCNISFRFGSLNTSVKKTAASISNDDLQGRKK